jgi:hypothetical protein
LWAFLGVVASPQLRAAPAAAEKVDLELVLADDVRLDGFPGTGNPTGWLCAALAHPEVVDAIRAGYAGRIAVTYVEMGRAQFAGRHGAVDGASPRYGQRRSFRGRGRQSFPLPHLRHLHLGQPRLFGRVVRRQRLEGTRRVIDISGDGGQQHGTPVGAGAGSRPGPGNHHQRVAAAHPPSLSAAFGGFGLDDYYRDCVIGVRVLRHSGPRDRPHRRGGPPQADLRDRRPAPRIIPAAYRLAAGKADCMVCREAVGRWMRDRE